MPCKEFLSILKNSMIDEEESKSIFLLKHLEKLFKTETRVCSVLSQFHHVISLFLSHCMRQKQGNKGVWMWKILESATELRNCRVCHPDLGMVFHFSISRKTSWHERPKVGPNFFGFLLIANTLSTA